MTTRKAAAVQISPVVYSVETEKRVAPSCKTARSLASLLESSTMGQSVQHMRRLHAQVTLSRRRALSIVPAVLCQACRREHSTNAPSIEFTLLKGALREGRGAKKSCYTQRPANGGCSRSSISP